MRARAGRVALPALLLAACLAGAALAQPPAPGDSAYSRSTATGGPRTRGPQAPYKMPPIAKALGDDLHNKLIHFPIVLTMVAAVIVIVARRRRQLEPVAFWLVWAAALSVIPAYFTGKAQAEHFHGRPKEWLVGLHEKQGIVLGITQAIWVLSLLKAGTRRFAWIIGLILTVMVVGAGFIGGLVAHGH